MKPVGANQRGLGNVVERQRIVGAAVGEERALPRGFDDRDQPPRRQIGVALEPRRHAGGAEFGLDPLDVARPDAAGKFDLDALAR